MKRHFFESENAAGWMAEAHGFELTDEKGNKVWWDSAEGCLRSLWFVEGQPNSGRFWGRSYVQPGSLHLLAPTKGDLLSWHTPAIKAAAYRVVGFGLCESSAKRLVAENHGKVIQRDGKPFFWPECEAG